MKQLFLKVLVNCWQKLSFLAETETLSPLWTFFIADEGDIAVFPNNDQTKVRALLKIQELCQHICI